MALPHPTLAELFTRTYVHLRRCEVAIKADPWLRAEFELYCDTPPSSARDALFEWLWSKSIDFVEWTGCNETLRRCYAMS